MSIRPWHPPYLPQVSKLDRAASALGYIESSLLERSGFGRKYAVALALQAVDAYLTGLTGMRQGDEVDIYRLLEKDIPVEFMMSDPAHSRLLLRRGSSRMSPIEFVAGSRKVQDRWSLLLEHIRSEEEQN
jgi:hypothetical protein